MIAAIDIAIKLLGHAPARWLLVDTGRQRLTLMRGVAPQADWPISTAAAGLDARENSGGTPPGVHRIDRKIGAGADPGVVFVDREPTGEVWDGRPDPRDLILGRILPLAGCQDGVNRGAGVDSLARYIYLHGTNHGHRIGEPCSHGCVRLRPADVIEVFDRVEAGDPVVIV
ncbi:MAG TPA: L,D-transpeptidase [Candidatus Krumholzibacteria bacterium]|nr:L,D-transpeptidase [Candidatus Krumholzibacteria bacterium]HPD73148.1 L,D-transpeptidase [Candidatus Krumholzibacteria bacterium]HRY41974.1 L,D-transpeptidase [Candidatus Krumholzibacteria bacterium]